MVFRKTGAEKPNFRRIILAISFLFHPSAMMQILTNKLDEMRRLVGFG